MLENKSTKDSHKIIGFSKFGNDINKKGFINQQEIDGDDEEYRKDNESKANKVKNHWML